MSTIQNINQFAALAYDDDQNVSSVVASAEDALSKATAKDASSKANTAEGALPKAAPQEKCMFVHERHMPFFLNKTRGKESFGSSSYVIRTNDQGNVKAYELCDEEGRYGIDIPCPQDENKAKWLETCLYRAKLDYARREDKNLLKQLQEANSAAKQVRDVAFRQHRQANSAAGKAYKQVKKAKEDKKTKEEKNKLWLAAEELKKDRQRCWEILQQAGQAKKLANDKLQDFLYNPKLFIRDMEEEDASAFMTPPSTPKAKAEPKVAPPAPVKAPRPKVGPPPKENPWNKVNQKVKATSKDEATPKAKAPTKKAPTTPKAKAAPKKAPPAPVKAARPKVVKQKRKKQPSTEAKATKPAQMTLPAGFDTLKEYTDFLIERSYRKGFQAAKAANTPSA